MLKHFSILNLTYDNIEKLVLILIDLMHVDIDLDNQHFVNLLSTKPERQAKKGERSLYGNNNMEEEEDVNVIEHFPSKIYTDLAG